ncbi:uncharacterized protein AB675_10154 [Cyphellophora attinorum]|uniref:Uncharacterized protein n=1 Tax=Cyphellophora attinorum TaxID=1664694 RepID=A0A0N0NIA2_9EURO|nr:uncharacterized protein AB675_10154 [Phialophora attinorum]KPI35199.1 hypothetical protein AB675_10154 [Phialophora attinorum]
MPRRARQQSASVSSAVAEVNGLPPAPVSASKSPSPVAARHKRTRSTASQPGSPGKLAQALTTRPHQDVVEAAPLKFIIAVLSNMLLSGVVRYVLATYTSLGSGQLGAFSKNPEENPYTLAVIGWRILTLAVYWFGGFDAYDVASLTVLSATPIAILQFLFYKIKPQVMAIEIATSVISSAVPFYLLRSIAPAHHPGDKSTKFSLRNRAILTDPYTATYTSILGAAILAVFLELSFETYLPTFLIREFTYISTLEPAHRGAAQLPILVLSLLPAGVAFRSFLFAPSTSVPAVPVNELDTQSAGFVEHLKWNLWDEGISLRGAVGYAGIWALGYSLVTIVLDWVSKPADH